MTTSAIHHSPASLLTLAAAGLAGTLLSFTASSAHAIPERDESPPVVARTGQTEGHFVERGCFITPPTWNEAIDGGLPRCRTYVR